MLLTCTLSLGLHLVSCISFLLTHGVVIFWAVISITKKKTKQQKKKYYLPNIGIHSPPLTQCKSRIPHIFLHRSRKLPTLYYQSTITVLLSERFFPPHYADFFHELGCLETFSFPSLYKIHWAST